MALTMYTVERQKSATRLALGSCFPHRTAQSTRGQGGWRHAFKLSAVLAYLLNCCMVYAGAVAAYLAWGSPRLPRATLVLADQERWASACDGPGQGQLPLDVKQDALGVSSP